MKFILQQWFRYLFKFNGGPIYSALYIYSLFGLNEQKQKKKKKKKRKLFSIALFSLFSLLGFGFLIWFSSFFFVCVFVSIHHQAQELKVNWVSQLHFSMIFLFCFLEAIFFHIFNVVSFVFVHVGLLQILELRPKIALRFTLVWLLI